MNRVVHFEIPADDISGASKFYEGVFGWTFQKYEGPVDYWMIKTGDGEPGINGGLMERRGPGGWINVIDVQSVDDTVERIRLKGGKVVVDKMPIPGVGYLAYCQDTEDNVFGVMQMDESAA